MAEQAISSYYSRVFTPEDCNILRQAMDASWQALRFAAPPDDPVAQEKLRQSIALSILLAAELHGQSVTTLVNTTLASLPPLLSFWS
jgi:hypothetical protein